MTQSNATIGQQVVRSKGDYVVGRTGNIIAIDAEKNRAQVYWDGLKTWVSFSALEPTSIPYTIIDGYYDSKKKYHNQKYKAI